MIQDRHVFVSVLTATFSMTEEVAWALFDSACEIHAAGAAEASLHSKTVSGKVWQTSHVHLGGLCGPGFEADVATPKVTDGKVRFFVTHQGIELHGAHGRQPNQVN